MAVLLALQGGFALVLIGPVNSYVNRHLVEWLAGGTLRDRLLAYCAYAAGVGVLATLGSVGLAATVGIGVAASPLSLALFVGSLLAVHSVFQLLAYGLNILLHRAGYVLLSVAGAWLGLAASVAAVLTSAPTAEMWLAGQLIVESVLAVVAWVILGRLTGAPRQRTEPSPVITGTTGVGFTWPLAISLVFYWFQTQGYAIPLGALRGPEVVGVLSVVLGAGTRIASAFERLFNELYLPLFYKGVALGDARTRTEAWQRYATALFPALAFVTVFSVLTAPWLVRLLAAPAFQAAAGLAAVGAVIECARIALGGYHLGFHGHLRTRPLLIPSVLAAIVTGGAVVLASTSATIDVMSVGTIASVGLAGAGIVATVSAALLGRSLLGLRFPLRPTARAFALVMPLAPLALLADFTVDHSSRSGSAVILVVGALYCAVTLPNVLGISFIGWRAWLRPT